MPRRTTAFHLDHLDRLPLESRRCTFWEFDPRARHVLGGDDAEALKRAWLSRTLTTWGTCGQVAIVDGELIGFTFYAPGDLVPGGTLPLSGPIDDGTVLLLGTWVDPRWRGGGVAKSLIQATAKDLIQRHAADALEVIATTGTTGGHGRCECLLPEAFASAVGFEMQRAHPTYPRLRMSLRRTLPWSEELAASWRRLVVAVRPPIVAPRPRRSETTEARSGWWLSR
ncbi:GNAT family N-acetyltransferase [Nocardioides dubius]|uniref:N-acetyltransferase domain-containing protein n=1 Tax=Nocardioides dubius TaxID=317019 RepID=A0ABP4EPB4_9ACTN